LINNNDANPAMQSAIIYASLEKKENVLRIGGTDNN